MKFCPACGGVLARAIPSGDDRERAVCASCGAVHFENPKLVVGCLVEHESGLLLCRRAIEPARGRWTVPGGFLELAESITEGALRETREEACAEAEIIAPHAFFDLPHIGQIYALFRARLAKPGFAAGTESLDVRVFGLDELPFDELAFPVVHYALRHYLEDRAAGRHRVHHGAVVFSGQGSRFDLANCELRGHIAVPLAGDG